MKVEEFMSDMVVMVSMDESLGTMNRIFEETGFHHLLVKDGERLIGIISDRDVLKRLSPFVGKTLEQTKDRSTLQLRAHQLMSRRPVTVKAGSDVLEAASLMVKHRISCLPVRNEEGKVEGIVTTKGILEKLEGLLQGQSLREAVRPHSG